MSMQARKDSAMAKLAEARGLLDQVDALIASATHTLEVDGAYSEHGLGDVCGPVRDSMGELESLLDEYVN